MHTVVQTDTIESCISVVAARRSVPIHPTGDHPAHGPLHAKICIRRSRPLQIFQTPRPNLVSSHGTLSRKPGPKALTRVSFLGDFECEDQIVYIYGWRVGDIPCYQRFGRGKL